MTPIELVLPKLRGVRRVGSGWMATCPAHEDKRPSLAVSEGNDGRILLKCFAGCSVDSICAALGVEKFRLFPERGNGYRRGVQPPASSNAKPACKVYPTVCEAIQDFEWQRERKRAASWTYHDANGQPAGAVIRWDTATGKDIRPVSRKGTGWIIGAMPAPRPLYRLPELRDTDGRMYVVEGEKCVEALRTIGLPATTSAGGSNAAHKSDWSPVAGKECVILPDNDNAGQHYADDVAGILATLDPPATVRVVQLPNLPPGGDVVEHIEARRAAGLDDDAIRAELERLVDAAEPTELDRSAPAVEPWRPLPVNALPEPVRAFVSETAAALGCDPVYIALPALAAVASCIGTTRDIELKGSWREPAILWAVLIARSGSLKSPALDAALEPLRHVQGRAIAEHESAVETYKAERLEYEVMLTRWKRDRAKGGGGEPPMEPEIPLPVRYIVSDITLEALAPLLEANPRGVLLARDELSAWVQSFNQYKRGKGGDAGGWLELHRAGTLCVDRKASGTIFIHRPAVSVCGTIQPGVAARVFSSEYIEAGLVARLLVARPPERRKRWTNRTPSAGVLGAYERLIRDLLALEHVEGEHGPEPARLRLTDAAAAHWQAWYNVHAGRIADAGTDSLAAALAKIEAAAARFALIFALVDDPSADEVPDRAVERGTALANWFANEAQRVYAALEESDDDRDQRRLVELVQRKGGAVTARELQQASRLYGTAAAAEAALDELVRAELARWEQPPQAGRGAPRSRRLVLNTERVYVYRNAADDSASGNSVDVDSVDIPDSVVDEGASEPDLAPDHGIPDGVERPPEGGVPEDIDDWGVI